MGREIPKRIAIIGLPGSGKSTFASKLGKLLKYPVHHLDRHQFEEGGQKRDHQEFLSIQKAMLKEEVWIIEGCSISTLEMRFARADTVIYFHLPRLLCMWRIVKRLFLYDPSFGGLRCVTWEILQYIWNFDKSKREGIENLCKSYPSANFLIFKSSKDVDRYVLTISQLPCSWRSFG